MADLVLPASPALLTALPTGAVAAAVAPAIDGQIAVKPVDPFAALLASLAPPAGGEGVPSVTLAPSPPPALTVTHALSVTAPTAPAADVSEGVEPDGNRATSGDDAPDGDPADDAPDLQLAMMLAIIPLPLSAPVAVVPPPPAHVDAVSTDAPSAAGIETASRRAPSIAKAPPLAGFAEPAPPTVAPAPAADIPGMSRPDEPAGTEQRAGIEPSPRAEHVARVIRLLSGTALILPDRSRRAAAPPAAIAPAVGPELPALLPAAPVQSETAAPAQRATLAATAPPPVVASVQAAPDAAIDRAPRDPAQDIVIAAAAPRSDTKARDEVRPIVRVPIDASATPLAPQPSAPIVAPVVPVGTDPLPADTMVSRALSIARDGQWLDTLARDIAATAGKDGQLSFRLDPQHLGQLTVHVSHAADGASIRLSATSEAARSILADAQPRLAAEARAQGLTLRETSVDVGGSGAGQAGQQGQASAFAGFADGQSQRQPAPDHRIINLDAVERDDPSSPAPAGRSDLYA